ncbi:bifunctional diguanylate cyclase/phosphodiesterase [Sphingobium sp. CAP-1]|uniref:bifunctional diguanylate cyclase/phosphodiesterase n=1 Tax=Sphingobium sp. CAP-1 TaxID=2676077 RepID=UPI0012BB2189|nr:bifunctional diguanylate cyclase/phosphodiesterase [Sphingobium sp. CAP-1]QGP78087.1 diguanylate cyclase [Sphingobium sp. CAP-1]
MLNILFCIRDEHTPFLVFLAAIVCLLSATTAILMIRQARFSTGRAAYKWAMLGGLATGFGIWATHFIAMLGYDPGFITGYKIGLTSASLLIVLVTTVSAFLIARRHGRRSHLLVASLLAGSGFAAMHYVGMAAIEMPAIIQWRTGYVLLSILFAIAPLYPAFLLAAFHRSSVTGCAAALTITCAVVGLHFTGMTAIHLIPSQSDALAGTISPQTMSMVISVVSLALLALCAASCVMARRTHAAIAKSERQFSVLVKSISDCSIYMLDKKGCVANWNAGAERLKGYAVEEIIGSPLSRFYTSEERENGAADRALAIAAEQGKFVGEGWRLRKDGSKFWANTTIERLQDDQGSHIGFAKITRDMTQFKKDQERIEQARSQLDAALEHMHQGLCLFDADERLVLRNRRFTELWHLPEDSCQPGTTLMDVARAALEARIGEKVSSDRLQNMRGLLIQLLSDEGQQPLLSEIAEDFVVSISSRLMPGGGWVTTFEDITERRRSDARIAHMAHHDALTGLPNRVRFNHWLDAEIDRASARGQHVGLVAVDLDRFKEINDSQGHAAGDLVLQQIAKRLTEVLDDGEIAARLGGDEFAAAKCYTNPADMADFVERIDSCFVGATSSVDGVVVAGSLGIAMFPADATARESLLNNADLAMYRAKGSINEHICYYESGMDERARYRRQLANDIRQADPDSEWSLLYQPQTSLKTKKISGFEALLRWHHPRQGIISPAEFIPIAEETGEILRIGEWVLRTACKEAARWAGQEKIAVNLSPVQLLQPDLPEIVMGILFETGLSPHRLELEIVNRRAKRTPLAG